MYWGNGYYFGFLVRGLGIKKKNSVCTAKLKWSWHFNTFHLGSRERSRWEKIPWNNFFFHQYRSNPAWMAHSHLKLNKSQTEVLLSCLPILQNPTSPGFRPHWGPYQPPGSCCKLKDVLFMEGCAGNALPNFSSPIFLFLVDHHIFLIHFVFFQDIVELIIFDFFGGL